MTNKITRSIFTAALALLAGALFANAQTKNADIISLAKENNLKAVEEFEVKKFKTPLNDYVEAYLASAGAEVKKAVREKAVKQQIENGATPYSSYNGGDTSSLRWEYKIGEGIYDRKSSAEKAAGEAFDNLTGAAAQTSQNASKENSAEKITESINAKAEKRAQEDFNIYKAIYAAAKDAVKEMKGGDGSKRGLSRKEEDKYWLGYR